MVVERAGVAKSLRRLTVSAIFLSIALVLKTFFTIDIPLFGENGMRVGVSGIFSMMPAVLFGPFYGAAVSALADAMGFVLKPTGAYMPLMTVTAALGGFLRGGAYLWLRGRRRARMRWVVAVFALALLAAGVANIVLLRADGVDAGYFERAEGERADVGDMHAVSRLVVERAAGAKEPARSLAAYTIFLTSGLVGSAAFALALLAVDLVAGKRLAAGMMGLLLSVTVSGLIVTSLNTVILRESIYASWKVLPFAVVWIPRAIEEVLAGTVKVCFMAALLGIIEARPALRAMVG